MKIERVTFHPPRSTPQGEAFAVEFYADGKPVRAILSAEGPIVRELYTLVQRSLPLLGNGPGLVPDTGDLFTAIQRSPGFQAFHNAAWSLPQSPSGDGLVDGIRGLIRGVSSGDPFAIQKVVDVITGALSGNPTDQVLHHAINAQLDLGGLLAASKQDFAGFVRGIGR